ncbi:MAG: hypothetical protein AVDCRST_MAG88-1868 [uncultured Thermomicrobiales bacterium]|uniref:Uncharacterized protein n=1 Tax=uncultured Thermomicrobiales bacterium TaxID=1645740 RepID=A0A6J4V0K5_9BACT|nr:MAG: hypothetical protein AVDCRST_MAG88-1868 [uncultured Thermomicrobiales bacterium]
MVRAIEFRGVRKSFGPLLRGVQDFNTWGEML